MQPITNKDEKYYCNVCNTECKYVEVNRNWKCPECNDNIRIKISIDDFAHSCIRINHNDLKVGDQVTPESKFIYRVGEITKGTNENRIFLEGYGPLVRKNDDVITVIEGGWSKG